MKKKEIEGEERESAEKFTHMCTRSEIQGHTNGGGRDPEKQQRYRQELSLKRAQAVVDHLITLVSHICFKKKGGKEEEEEEIKR